MADGKPRIIANAAEPQLNFVVCFTSSILCMRNPYVPLEGAMRVAPDSRRDQGAFVGDVFRQRVQAEEENVEANRRKREDDRARHHQHVGLVRRRDEKARCSIATG